MADIEHDVKMIKVGPDFQKDVDQLTADGWKIMPGITPVVMYTMFREKHAEPPQLDISIEPDNMMKGEMIVDDTLVGIVRQNGKFERF